MLRELVVYMARRVAGVESDALAGEVLPWIEANLGTEYAWPGNYRELEQCVKNVLIRRNYRPALAAAPDPVEEFAREARDGLLTARRLGLDRRTVKAKVDAALLARLRGTGQTVPGA